LTVNNFIKNRTEIVVVWCLILCSKFTKSRLSAVLRGPPAGGAYTAPPDPLAGSSGKGWERGDGRAGGAGVKEEGRVGVSSR